jgi:hypothetical protein
MVRRPGRQDGGWGGASGCRGLGGGRQLSCCSDLIAHKLRFGAEDS